MSMNQIFATWWVEGDDREMDPCLTFNWYIPYDGYDFDSLNETMFRGNVACMLNALSEKDTAQDIIVDGKADWVAYERGVPTLVTAGEIVTYMGPFPSIQSLLAVTANVKTPVDDSCPYGYHGGGYGYGAPGCGDALIIDLQKKPCVGGVWTSVLGNKIYIDAGKHCSGESALQPTIVDSAIGKTDLMRFVVLQTGLNASHLTVTMFCGTNPVCSGDGDSGGGDGDGGDDGSGSTVGSVGINKWTRIPWSCTLGVRNINKMPPSYIHVEKQPVFIESIGVVAGIGLVAPEVTVKKGAVDGVWGALTAVGATDTVLADAVDEIILMQSECVRMQVANGFAWPSADGIADPHDFGVSVTVSGYQRQDWPDDMDANTYRVTLGGLVEWATVTNGWLLNRTHLVYKVSGALYRVEYAKTNAMPYYIELKPSGGNWCVFLDGANAFEGPVTAAGPVGTYTGTGTCTVAGY